MGKDKVEELKSYNTFKYFDVKRTLFVRKWAKKIIEIPNLPNCRKMLKIINTEIDLTSWSDSERWFPGDKKISISERNFDKKEILWLSNKFRINIDSKNDKESCKMKQMIIKKTDNRDYIILIFCLTDFERKPSEELYVCGVWKSKLPTNIILKFYPEYLEEN